MPLLKAMFYFAEVEAPPQTARYFDAHAVLGTAVIGAPMLGVKRDGEETRIELTPWVRILRHEPTVFHDRHVDRLFVIDVIHQTFLEEYLNKHVLSFAEKFSEMVVKHQMVLATGRAFVSGLGENSFSDIEPRMSSDGESSALLTPSEEG